MSILITEHNTAIPNCDTREISFEDVLWSQIYFGDIFVEVLQTFYSVENIYKLMTQLEEEIKQYNWKQISNPKETKFPILVLCESERTVSSPLKHDWNNQKSHSKQDTPDRRTTSKITKV